MLTLSFLSCRLCGKLSSVADSSMFPSRLQSGLSFVTARLPVYLHASSVLDLSYSLCLFLCSFLQTSLIPLSFSSSAVAEHYGLSVRGCLSDFESGSACLFLSVRLCLARFAPQAEEHRGCCGDSLLQTSLIPLSFSSSAATHWLPRLRRSCLAAQQAEKHRRVLRSAPYKNVLISSCVLIVSLWWALLLGKTK